MAVEARLPPWDKPSRARSELSRFFRLQLLLMVRGDGLYSRWGREVAEGMRRYWDLDNIPQETFLRWLERSFEQEYGQSPLDFCRERQRQRDLARKAATEGQPSRMMP